MTVQQLIDKLTTVQDKSQTVEVAVRQYNKVGNVAYCEIQDNGYPHLQSDGLSQRIEIILPYDNETFTVLSKRKK